MSTLEYIQDVLSPLFGRDELYQKLSLKGRLLVVNVHQCRGQPVDAPATTAAIVAGGMGYYASGQVLQIHMAYAFNRDP